MLSDSETKYILSNTSKMNISNNRVILGPYSTTLNNSNDSSSYTVTKTGDFIYNDFDLDNYTSHKDIGRIAFNQTLNSITSSGTYTIHSDNLGEFIVGWSNQTWDINGSKSYKDLFYNGLVSSKSVLDNSKIYIYTGYKGLKFDDNESSFHIISNRNLYINSKTNSISSNTTSNIEKSGWEFNLGKINSNGTITAKSYSYIIDNEGVESKNESNVSGQLYGSESQGIGLNGQIDTKSLPSLTTNKTNKIAESYYLKSTSSINSDGNVTYNGEASELIVSGSNNSNKSVSFSINQNTGEFSSGTISNYSFNGNVPDLTSYYIDSDNFGVLIDTCTNCDGGETMLSNSSWMIAIGDKVNSDNTISSNIDNESSWGYWTASFKDSQNTLTRINPYSTWVAGNKTDISYVQNLMDSSTIKTLNFKGNVIGAIVNGTDFNAIKLDSNNQINFNFSLGSSANTFTGNFAFDTVSNKSWSGNFAGNLTSSEFNTTSFTNLSEVNKSATPNVTSSLIVNTSSLKGNYFGTNDIKSVGGTFKIETDGSGTALGSFKADKVAQ